MVCMLTLCRQHRVLWLAMNGSDILTEIYMTFMLPYRDLWTIIQCFLLLEKNKREWESCKFQQDSPGRVFSVLHSSSFVTFPSSPWNVFRRSGHSQETCGRWKSWRCCGSSEGQEGQPCPCNLSCCSEGDWQVHRVTFSSTKCWPVSVYQTSVSVLEIN